MKKEWIKIKEKALEDAAPVKKVKKSGLQSIMGLELDSTTKESTQIIYELGGAWKGTFQNLHAEYDTISIPRTATTTEEGAPEIPQEGIFVAVPNGVTNIKVKVIKKEMQSAPGSWKLKPSPKPITEIEYIEGKEEYKPKSEFYNSDNEYPGKDFDFLGLKTLEGVPVAHLMVYLAQYKPLSGLLSLVKTMTLEISYDISPQTDAIPKMRDITPLMGDLILDFESVKEKHLDRDDINVFDPKKALIDKGMDQPGNTGLTADPETIITPVLPHVSPIITGPVITPFPIITLKRTNIISEYIIITPNSLKNAVQPLLLAKSGWPNYAMIATTETIIAEFPAASLKASIKAFLTWAWDNWMVPPRFVVLAGDTDTIPVDMKSVGGTTYPSDHYYADIHGSLAPEIVVSRIPTSNVTNMHQICQRLAGYENLRGPDWGGWQNEVLLVAYESSTYKNCSNDIATTISPRFKVTKKYGDSSTKQQVINEMNQGILIANYRGHGSKTNWSSSNGINTQDIGNLTNGNRPPMVFCICCQNAWIDDANTVTVVERFLREGKAVAAFGASRNSPTYANNDFNKYIFQAIMDGETTPGRIIQRAKTLMIANHGNSTTHKQDVVMYMLFGDPTAKVVSNVEFLRGIWDMDHDGWKGVLNINRIWQHRVEKIGSCGYPVWSFSGKYSRGGKQYSMNGKIGGKDSRNLNPGCKRSDHKAGYTWWAKRPFCWYAKKRT